MILTLNIFHADGYLYKNVCVCVCMCVCVCVCVCVSKLNQISISYGLLKAVSIVMTNEKLAFHRFLFQNMWHSHLFLCPSVCSPYTITACLHGNSQWSHAHTSQYPLCVLLYVCPHTLSGIITHLRAHMLSQWVLCPWQPPYPFIPSR
jgi:hypothetical protein